MNLDRYLRDYERSVRNLPAILDDWAGLPSSLRQHYADELALMLARRQEAVSLAEADDRIVGTMLKFAMLDVQLRSCRAAIRETMGFDPFDLVVSAVTDSSQLGDTVDHIEWGQLPLIAPEEMLPLAA